MPSSACNNSPFSRILVACTSTLSILNPHLWKHCSYQVDTTSSLDSHKNINHSNSFHLHQWMNFSPSFEFLHDEYTTFGPYLFYLLSSKENFTLLGTPYLFWLYICEVHNMHNRNIKYLFIIYFLLKPLTTNLTFYLLVFALNCIHSL